MLFKITHYHYHYHCIALDWIRLKYFSGGGYFRHFNIHIHEVRSTGEGPSSVGLPVDGSIGKERKERIQIWLSLICNMLFLFTGGGISCIIYLFIYICFVSFMMNSKANCSDNVSSISVADEKTFFPWFFRDGQKVGLPVIAGCELNLEHMVVISRVFFFFFFFFLQINI